MTWPSLRRSLIRVLTFVELVSLVSFDSVTGLPLFRARSMIVLLSVFMVSKIQGFLLGRRWLSWLIRHVTKQAIRSRALACRKMRFASPQKALRKSLIARTLIHVCRVCSWFWFFQEISALQLGLVCVAVVAVFVRRYSDIYFSTIWASAKCFGFVHIFLFASPTTPVGVAYCDVSRFSRWENNYHYSWSREIARRHPYCCSNFGYSFHCRNSFIF